MNTNDLIKALQKGVVTIVFKKLDTGDIRTMPCTLNNDIADQKLVVHRYSSPDTILCFGLDVNAWRDVRVTTIKDWYEGYPKEEVL